MPKKRDKPEEIVAKLPRSMRWSHRGNPLPTRSARSVSRR